MGTLDKQITSFQESRVLEIKASGGTDEQEIENILNPILARGWNLITIGSAGSRLYAFFTRIKQ